MPLISIADMEAAELRIFTELSENQLKHYYEPHGGLFIAESEKVTERAYASGCVPVAMLAEEKYAEAEQSFRDARAEVSRYFGRNRAYASITKNLALALERQGKLAEAKEQMELAETVLKELNA